MEVVKSPAGVQLFRQRAGYHLYMGKQKNKRRQALQQKGQQLKTDALTTEASYYMRSS